MTFTNKQCSYEKVQVSNHFSALQQAFNKHSTVLLVPDNEQEENEYQGVPMPMKLNYQHKLDD